MLPPLATMVMTSSTSLTSHVFIRVAEGFFDAANALDADVAEASADAVPIVGSTYNVASFIELVKKKMPPEGEDRVVGSHCTSTKWVSMVGGILKQFGVGWPFSGGPACLQGNGCDPSSMATLWASQLLASRIDLLVEPLYVPRIAAWLRAAALRVNVNVVLPTVSRPLHPVSL
jgi:hypothetical protein